MIEDTAPEPVIRKAGAGDLDVITQLCAAHAAYERAAFDASGHGERLAASIGGPDPRLVIFLAEVEGNAAGYAAASVEFSTWHARDYLHMDCLFVIEPMRGRGIGGGLFDAVAGEARARGIDEIQWQTPDWNEDAVRFYRARGAAGQPKTRFTIDLR